MEKADKNVAILNATERIDQRIGELKDWRGETLARVRQIIRQADPGIVEEWKCAAFPSGRVEASSARAKPTKRS